MDALVFYCSNCKQTFLGGDYKEADRPPCPNCKRRTQSTGITKNVWVEMSKEERQEKLDALTQQEEKEKTRKAYAQSVGVTYEENANHNEGTAVDGWYTDIGKKIKGFDRADSIILGVESRTSSPVRITRDENFESVISGIYPCGERCLFPRFPEA